MKSPSDGSLSRQEILAIPVISTLPVISTEGRILNDHFEIPHIRSE